MNPQMNTYPDCAPDTSFPRFRDDLINRDLHLKEKKYQTKERPWPTIGYQKLEDIKADYEIAHDQAYHIVHGTQPEMEKIPEYWAQWGTKQIKEYLEVKVRTAVQAISVVDQNTEYLRRILNHTLETLYYLDGIASSMKNHRDQGLEETRDKHPEYFL